VLLFPKLIAWFEASLKVFAAKEKSSSALGDKRGR
jgi:hypothetical protein